MSSLKISTPKFTLRPPTSERLKGFEARPTKTSAPKGAGHTMSDGFETSRGRGRGVDRSGSSFEPARSGTGRAGSASSPKSAAPKLSQELTDSLKKAAADIASRVAETDKVGQRKAITDLIKGLNLSKEESRLARRTVRATVKACYASGSGASGNKTFGGE